jgi:hypothetical protein
MAKGIQREPFAHGCEQPGTCNTTKKKGCPALVLITHFAAEIMLIAFLNQGCERPSSGFECHLTADVASDKFTQFLDMVEQHYVFLRRLQTELWPATGRGLRYMYTCMTR